MLPHGYDDLRYLEHPSLGLVAIKSDISSEDVDSFISWIQRVLTPVAEAKAWSNLPRTLDSDTAISSSVIRSCSEAARGKRSLQESRRSTGNYGGGSYGGGPYAGGYGGGGYGGGGGVSAAKRGYGNPSLMKCYVCGETGHRAAVCSQNTNAPTGGADSRRSYGYGQDSSAPYRGSVGYGDDDGPAIGTYGGGYGGGSSAADLPAKDDLVPAKKDETTSPALSGGVEGADWMPKVSLVKGEMTNLYELSSGED